MFWVFFCRTGWYDFYRYVLTSLGACIPHSTDVIWREFCPCCALAYCTTDTHGIMPSFKNLLDCFKTLKLFLTHIKSMCSKNFNLRSPTGLTDKSQIKRMLSPSCDDRSLFCNLAAGGATVGSGSEASSIYGHELSTSSKELRRIVISKNLILNIVIFRPHSMICIHE